MNNFICNLFISFLNQIIKVTLYKGGRNEKNMADIVYNNTNF